jgi:hypothetical protein
LLKFFTRINIKEKIIANIVPKSKNDLKPISLISIPAINPPELLKIPMYKLTLARAVALS